MLELDLRHSGVDVFSSELAEKAKAVQEKEQPAHALHLPDFRAIDRMLKETDKYPHVIIAGRGGSTSSFEAMFKALAERNAAKKVFVLKSTDPDLIAFIKKNAPSKDSIFVCISKSGETVDVIENLMAFKEYPTVIITQKENGALKKIAEMKGIAFLEHPDIGGRFCAGTYAALFPAKLAGVNAEEVTEGLKDAFELFSPKRDLKENIALQAALVLLEWEEKGLIEVFMPIYSSLLSGFSELIMQLMHESVGKQGKGQTFLVAEAPQCQHHTNQRFFDGRKNMAGFFLRQSGFEDMEAKTLVPKEFQEIALRHGSLADLHNIPLYKTLEFEFKGTFEDAISKNIPVISLSLKKVTPYSIGQLIAFFQFLAIYSAWLRGLNPFDQPAVEASKRISFGERKGFRQKK